MFCIFQKLKIITKAKTVLLKDLNQDHEYSILLFHWTTDRREVFLRSFGGEILKVILPNDFNLLSEEDFREITGDIDSGKQFTLIYRGMEAVDANKK